MGRRKVWGHLGVLVVCAMSMTACGSGADVAADRRVAIEHVQGRASAASRTVLHRGVEEVLPNVRFRTASGEAFTLAHTVVVGRVTGARAGAGYVDAPADGTTRRVGYSSPQADWRTVILSVEVERVLGTAAGRAPKEAIELVVATGAGRDDQVLRGLGALGRAVLFLGVPGSFTDEEAGLYPVVEDGAMIGLVDDAGRLSFPMRERDPGFTEAAPTLRELERWAAAPERVIQLEGTDAAPKRSA